MSKYPKNFRILEQHEKIISYTAPSWMRLTLIGFFVQQNVHRMMHQRSLFCQPANLDEPVSLGDRPQAWVRPKLNILVHIVVIVGASAVNFELGSLVLSWMELGQPRLIPPSKTIITIIMITIIMITITINLVMQVLVLCSVRPTANTRKVLVVATQDGRGQSAL